MSTLGRDLRHAVRGFARTPGFTIAAVLSLAIGIGANTAIFSVASALLLRPLPYRDADRLVILWNTSPGLGISEDWFSTAQYFDIVSATRSFEQVAIAIGGNENLTGRGEAERVGTISLSPNLLHMLGARTDVGRLLTDEDASPGTTGRALLGHGTWQRRFGGDPAVVGTAITLNGRPFEVVGVLSSSFDLPREVMPTLGGAEHAEIVVPLQLAAKAAQVRNGEDYNILARLRPGATLDEARTELDTLTARLRREHPDFYPPNGGLRFVALPLQEQVVGSVRRSILVLAGAVALVLVIACANVGSLLLSRALARRKEIAVRAALGARRGQLVRQFVTESVVLAAGGGIVGVGLAMLTLGGIEALGAASVPRLHEVSIDGGVLLFTALVSIASGVLFGLVPALRLSRLDLHEHLTDATRGSSAAGALWGRRRNTRQLVVVTEVALSVVLLVGAGLLVRSYWRLQEVPAGFKAANVLTFDLTMTGARYGDPSVVLETYKRLWERLRQLPGVTAAGGISALPLSQMMAWGPITVEGRTAPAGERFLNADQRSVSGEYFEAMEIPLLSGRRFSEHDTFDAPRVVIVDEHMARTLWPGEDAIGKRIRTGGFDVTADTPWMTVIGVAGRVKQDALDSDPRIAFYRAHTQSARRALTVVVRSQAEPARLTAAIKETLRQLDADLPMYRVQTMMRRVDESLAQRRFAMLLLLLFASVAVGLAAVGTYGVVAYLVNQGTREIGIRLALGATPRAMLVQVVAQGMAVAAVGIVIGLGVSAGVTRFMQGLLFGVEPTDPATFAAIAMLLAALALAACAVPALRAARVDPTVALRQE